MIGIDEQINLFKLIGTELKEKMECLAIGGSAMLFYGLKSATKDIDLVFVKEKDMKDFILGLEKIGFKARKIKIFKYESIARKVPVIMERKDLRFDLFCKEIISFKLSQGMLDRIKEKHEFGNLTVNVCSPEDVILLKCATDRVGDRKDATELVKNFDLNWDIIIKESLWQTKHGRKTFSVFLFDFLEELKENYKANIPRSVIKKVMKISEAEMLKVLGKKKLIKIE